MHSAKSVLHPAKSDYAFSKVGFCVLHLMDAVVLFFAFLSFLAFCRSECLAHTLGSEHDLSIASAEFAIAGGGEVEFVEVAGASERRHHIGCWDYEWHGGYHAVVERAGTSVLLCGEFAHKQRACFGFEAEVGEHALVDEFHALGPVALTVVGTALV